MIKYDPLWQTLKAKNISQYQLIKDYGIDKAQLQRLRQKYGSKDHYSEQAMSDT